MRLRTVGVRGAARGVAAASILVMSIGAAATMAAAQEATTDDAGTGSGEDVEVALPEAYLDGYAWWSKTQQSPAGGQGVPAETCTPTDVNQCPAGPPPDGIYVVYDYEAVAPTVVTGPINNLPTVPVPEAPPGSPTPNVSPPRIAGPIAFGAVRFIVPDGAETELTLNVLSKSSTTPGGQDPSVGKVFACLVASPGWAATQNGRYDQAPTYDCSSADEGDIVGDQVVFDFPSGMVQNGTLDVVIVGAGDRPFQMSFAAPKNESLQILNADALVEEIVDYSEEDFTIEDPLTEFTESTYVDTPLVGDVAYTSDDSVLALAPPIGRPQPERAVTAGRFVNPFSPDASRGERVMAVALLMLTGGALWWVGGMPIRPPRLLGSLGNGRTTEVGPSTMGGIGRFARPRSGRPPRL